MERTMDAVGMLMVSYDNYAKALKAQGNDVKSFGAFVLNALKGNK